MLSVFYHLLTISRVGPKNQKQKYSYREKNRQLLAAAPLLRFARKLRTARSNSLAPLARVARRSSATALCAQAPHGSQRSIVSLRVVVNYYIIAEKLFYEIR